MIALFIDTIHMTTTSCHTRVHRVLTWNIALYLLRIGFDSVYLSDLMYVRKTKMLKRINTQAYIQGVA